MDGLGASSIARQCTPLPVRAWMVLLLLSTVLIALFEHYDSHIRPVTRPPRTGIQATRVGGQTQSISRSETSCHVVNTADSWYELQLPGHLQSVSQEDPELIEYICQQWIIAPSTKERALKEPNKVHYSQNNQSVVVDQILKGRTNGFYVECGAFDGEMLSNSLFFEKTRNWSGLLIEGNKDLFKSILSLNRHAYLVQAGLSPRPRPIISTFTDLEIGWGGLTDYMAESHKIRIGHRVGRQAIINNTRTIQCLPLYSVLQAIGISHVDYFSLDIEGAELEVLQTLPLDKVAVDVFSIEYVVGGRSEVTIAQSQKKLEAIRNYLVNEHQYEMIMISQSEDVIFKRLGI